MQFNTKKQCKDYFKNILNKYNQGNKITDTIESDNLLKLISLHKDAIDKIGTGIKFIYITCNPYISTINEFRICRNDNTEIDFSYIKIIDQNTLSIINNKFITREEKINEVLGIEPTPEQTPAPNYYKKFTKDYLFLECNDDYVLAVGKYKNQKVSDLKKDIRFEFLKYLNYIKNNTKSSGTKNIITKILKEY